nr:unnamed protein product [Callosobruchus analis]
MKQVGCLSSAERGQLVTAEICFNVAGTYVPPMLIYPRKRMKNELLDDAPPGFWGACSDNGSPSCEAFCKRLPQIRYNADCHQRV